MGLPYCSFGILIPDFMEFLDILKHQKNYGQGIQAPKSSYRLSACDFKGV